MDKRDEMPVANAQPQFSPGRPVPTLSRHSSVAPFQIRCASCRAMALGFCATQGKTRRESNADDNARRNLTLAMSPPSSWTSAPIWYGGKYEGAAVLQRIASHTLCVHEPASNRA